MLILKKKKTMTILLLILLNIFLGLFSFHYLKGSNTVEALDFEMHYDLNTDDGHAIKFFHALFGTLIFIVTLYVIYNDIMVYYSIKKNDKTFCVDQKIINIENKCFYKIVEVRENTLLVTLFNGNKGDVKEVEKEKFCKLY